VDPAPDSVGAVVARGERRVAAGPVPKDAVAIDGPAGAGKSTVARLLARRLGWTYVDSGAMYRAVTLKAVRAGVDLEDVDAVVEVARAARVEPAEVTGSERTLLDGEDVSDEIRRPELTRLVRKVAGAGPARKVLVDKQRRLAEGRPVVMEGRDIGTVVLPDARVKFFLDASLEERARRRARDLRRAGVEVALDALRAELASRDRSDRGRKVGPLALAEDAEVVDTTDMALEEVVDLLASKTREILDGRTPGRRGEV